jgi:hypothetical protein
MAECTSFVRTSADRRKGLIGMAVQRTNPFFLQLATSGASKAKEHNPAGGFERRMRLWRNLSIDAECLRWSGDPTNLCGFRDGLTAE